MDGAAKDAALSVSADGRDVSVALGAAPAGRLEFANGTAQTTMRADSALDKMLRAHFEGTPPKASLTAETVTFRYPRVGRPFDWRQRSADVTLTTQVPWEIDVRGGAARLDADLRELELLAFHVGGGIAEIEVQLPPPVGVVPITIGGGASNVRLMRPEEVPVQLQIRGGVSQLAFDKQEFGAVGGRVRLQSDRFDEREDRYEITIGGGASKLTIGSVAPR